MADPYQFLGIIPNGSVGDEKIYQELGLTEDDEYCSDEQRSELWDIVREYLTLKVQGPNGHIELTINSPTKEDAVKAVKNVDWNIFHFVYVAYSDDTFHGEHEVSFDVSGSLEEDGLSSSYGAYVIDDAPESVDDLVDIMTKFVNDDQNLKDSYSDY